MDENRASSTGPGNRTGDEQRGAMAGLAKAVHERAGHFPGFDFVLAFISDEALTTHNLSYESSLFLTSEEQSSRIAERFSSEGIRLDLILTVLRLAMDSEEDPSAAALARRIAAKMISGGPDNPVAKPMLYISGAPGGIAVALAVHDHFWTGEW